MNPEQKQSSPPFDSSRLVREILAERAERGGNSMFDEFMSYVNNTDVPPWHPGHGRVTYDLPLLQSYSVREAQPRHKEATHLVLVRESSQLPAFEPERYYVVTADLRARTTTVWSVSKIIPLKDDRVIGNTSLGIELVLTDSGTASVLEHSPDPDLPVEPARFIYDCWKKRAEARQAAVGTHRIVLENRGCWYIGPDNDPEQLQNLIGVCEGVRQQSTPAQEMPSTTPKAAVTM